MQRALMQYKNPKNRQLVKEALQQTNRGDLIGDDAKCLLKISSSHNPKARHSKIAFNHKINRRVSNKLVKMRLPINIRFATRYIPRIDFCKAG